MVRFVPLIQDSFKDAARLAPVAPHLAVLHVLAATFAAWVVHGPGQNQLLLLGLAYLAWALIFCAYQVRLFQRLLPIQQRVWQRALKLFVATLLVGFLIGMAVAVFILLFTMVAGSFVVATSGEASNIQDVVAMMMRTGIFWPIFVIFLLSLGMLIWFVSRLFLYGVATAATGQIHIFRTWAWTKTAEGVVFLSFLALVSAPNIIWYGVRVQLESAWAMAEGPALAYVQLEFVLALLFLPFIWLQQALAVNLYRQLAPTEAAQDTTSDSDKARISAPE